jgi:hypothetical protein
LPSEQSILSSTDYRGMYAWLSTRMTMLKNVEVGHSSVDQDKDLSSTKQVEVTKALEGHVPRHL